MLGGITMEQHLDVALGLSLDALERWACSLVGTGGVCDARDRLTRGMLKEALRRTAGNYTRTAYLLGVKRQAIQQMVTRFQLAEWAESCSAAPAPPAK
jgi:hypothetical protein